MARQSTTELKNNTMILLAAILSMAALATCSNQRKTYVVYMGSVTEDVDGDDSRHLLAAHRHHSLLSSLLGDEDLAAQVRLVSYGKSIDGFAADLLPEEAAKLRGNEKVVSVFRSTRKKLFTTFSWDYLEMPLSVPRRFEFESDIIIGMIDTGIYVDHPSFDDKGLGPPPAKWRGVCQQGYNFTGCNKKVIGARAYDVGRRGKNPPTPLDGDGHGTHTASTVAGVEVDGASFNGLANGTARGGVPSARLAIYRCNLDNEGGCNDLNIMAAFDDAIHDGVDVISVSLGSSMPLDYWNDAIAIGSFHAAKRGVLVSAAAGNEVFPGTVTNLAPWILTVGASRTRQQLRTPVLLGNGFSTLGVSYNYLATVKWYPIVNVEKAANDTSGHSGNCERNNLDPEKVRGKILYCRNGEETPYSALKEFGGVGFVGATSQLYYPDYVVSFPIPSALFNPERADIIDEYINSSSNPRAAIMKTVPVNVTVPATATFSSRGPNQISRTILKPDVVAPGVNILAAYAPTAAAADHSYGHTLNFLSGTSMACPHATAAAAYVKSYHPDWSPAAIKSALMTTARVVVKDQTDPWADYAYGSGEIDPTRAVDPGLVYDMSSQDYVRFLCAEGYSGTALSVVTGDGGNCTLTAASSTSTHDVLNYPSMNVQLDANSTAYVAVFNRTVTNVGPGVSSYNAEVEMTSSPGGGMEVTVVPDGLEFKEVGETKTFTVEVKVPGLVPDKRPVISGSVVWVGSAGHRVRSPVVVSFGLPFGEIHI